MTIGWVNLSTRWSLTSVQAALNVIISVLGTVGIWAFSRYWWQRGSTSILRSKSKVPLSALLSPAGPGEGWDAVAVLRRRVFAKENWCLLFQLIVVIAATLACMFSGPIAKVSLRSTRTVQASELEVLQTTKGDGSLGNRLDANVLWNDTIQSLDQAGFPNNQLLDFLPPSTAPWTYVAREWNPMWSVTCSYMNETILHNVTATGNDTFSNPVDAFPAYRDTYDPSWLDTSKYRIQADFDGWSIVTDQHKLYFKDALFFILIQSDPEIDDRMYTNNETLQISISAFHAQNFQSLTYDDATQAGEKTWRPIGPVGNASFARVECNITQKPKVPDENAIPWVWTNDTYSITFAYRTYWLQQVGDRSRKNLTVSAPTPKDLFRFYQAYMASVNTIYAFPSLRKVSIWMDTVQLSIVLLAMVIILTSLALWLSGRYFWFLRRHKSELEQMYIPDGKIEWMIHAAKISAYGAEEEIIEGKRAKDRDYFRGAAFGNSNTDLQSSDAGMRPPGLARVYTSRSSVSGATPSSIRGSLLRDASQRRHPPVTVHDGKEDRHDGKEDGHNLNQIPSSVGSYSDLELIVSSDCESSQSCSREHSPHPDGNMLSPQISRKSSAGGSQPSSHYGTYSSKSSFRLIVPEIEEVDPIDPTSVTASHPDEKQ